MSARLLAIEKKTAIGFGERERERVGVSTCRGIGDYPVRVGSSFGRSMIARVAVSRKLGNRELSLARL